MRPIVNRQQAILTTALASFAAIRPPPAFAAQSIKERLDTQDSKLLLKPQNQGLSTPAEAEFPDWLEGEWQTTQSFAGYELPAKEVISREDLFGPYGDDVPGFKKCSIALLPDVGKDPVRMTLRWTTDAQGKVRERRAANLNSAIRGGLGYDAIERIDYLEDSGNNLGLGSNKNNPNRLKLVFAGGLTNNADRIELFVNARETERPREDLFYTAEAFRQVTFSPGRSINGEYAHFHSYRRVSPDQIDAVIVTAVYADPLQLERFFVKAGGNRPLVVFSHSLRMSRKPAAPAPAPVS